MKHYLLDFPLVAQFQPSILSPLCITVGLLKDVIATVNVHDAVLEMKLPPVSTSRNLNKRKKSFKTFQFQFEC